MPIKRPFRSVLQKISKSRNFTIIWSKILKLLPDTHFDTSFQNNVLVSLQLFLFVCYEVFLSYVQWNKIASSTACNLHNDWPLLFKFLETRDFCQNIWLEIFCFNFSMFLFSFFLFLLFLFIYLFIFWLAAMGHHIPGLQLY